MVLLPAVVHLGWNYRSLFTLAPGGRADLLVLMPVLAISITAFVFLGEPRYRMLETIREYSRERLREGPRADIVHQRHRDYFLALTERACVFRRRARARPIKPVPPRTITSFIGCPRSELQDGER